MGLGLLEGIGAAALIGSDVAGLSAQASAIQAQEQSVKLEAAQQNVAFSQKTLNNIESTKRMIETQAVQASGSGESLASPTIKALTLDTFQTGKKTQTNIDTEAKISQLSAQSKLDALSDESSALPFEFLGKVTQQGVELGNEFNWF